MIVSENEVYQIVKKSCVSEKIYEDWADDIGKAIALLQKNNMDGCEEFKNLKHEFNDILTLRANIKLMLILLSVWFLVSFGFGILLVDELNTIQFFGFKFGFWWAQQGSIYVFVVLIFVYSAMMKRIDKKYETSDLEDE